jgi:hypothetical protein
MKEGREGVSASYEVQGNISTGSDVILRRRFCILNPRKGIVRDKMGE